MIKFIATEQQILEIAANAVNAAEPMGMGFLHFRVHTYTVEDVRKCLNKDLHIDYFDGRMVKLYIRKHEDENTWEIYDDRPRWDYQSWCHKYNTYEALLASVIPA